jgi:NAD(P)H-dependent FMN reductase
LFEAGELVPKGASLEIYELDGFPLFNQDRGSAMPDKSREFKTKIEAPDAFIPATLPALGWAATGSLSAGFHSRGYRMSTAQEMMKSHSTAFPKKSLS